MNEWATVTKSDPCPICGKPDWCAIGTDVERPVAKCMRILNGPTAVLTGEDGSGMYAIHRLDTDHPLPQPRKKKGHRKITDFKKEAMACYSHFAKYPGDRRTAAENLGVSVESLVELRAGHMSAIGDRTCLTFPMRDHNRNVIGVRIRSNDNAEKWAMPGSKSGLFIPNDITFGRVVFVVEGPTDTAAMHTLGLQAIGRPGATAGKDYIVNLFGSNKNKGVIVMPDSDAKENEHVMAGAKALVAALREAQIKVAGMLPPGEYNDAREAVADGCKKSAFTDKAKKAFKKG